MPRKKAAFKCEKCGKTFAMPMHLGRHMTMKHGQAPMKSATPAMAKKTANVGAATQLASLVNKLQAERQEHLDAIAQIDATFEQFGIVAAPVKKRLGRPRKTSGVVKPAKAAKRAAKKGKRSVRRQFTKTGNESILGFVKAAGAKGATTSEIVKHWKSEKRSGDGYTALGQLVTAKKLKKEKIKDGQGSRYTAV